MSDEEQHLAAKLKETYKNIVNLEETVQKSCMELTVKINQKSIQGVNSTMTSMMFAPDAQGPISSSPVAYASPTNTTELSNNLWTIYHYNVTLLNNYYDFLITALKPTANTSQFRIGKNIVDLYKIPRRMWVYGIVGFLEVLKNIMSIFQDHEIFLCFIAHCFNIVSNLTDPSLEMEGWWCEKLGDLSRMAIALYASRFIDWKISAEYWYSVAMKTMYGHGKIYYHMCTVQQDNLDALVNIGKSVFCRDPFVPTQQYLRLVVENICTQRNILSLLELPTIDFIKIHKVLLSIHSNSQNSEGAHPAEHIHDAQLQYGIDLVTRYGLTFGCDSHGYNFFTRIFCIPGGNQKHLADPFNSYLKQQHEQEQHANSMDFIDKINFWFNKGSLFAIANINHLIGFGDPKNPFAKIFNLPEALKERREKKDRKKKSKGSHEELVSEDNRGSIASMGGNGADLPHLLASDLSAEDWFYCLPHINKSVLELSFRILNHYLIGPKQASTCHVIVWLYFLIAVGEASLKYPQSKPLFMWLFRRFFPWEALINYLNTIFSVVANNKHLSTMCKDYISQHPDYIGFFNENEFLPEVWKCWGSLWFDTIYPKQDYNDEVSAGVPDHGMFDLPICGTSPVININNSQHTERNRERDKQERDNDERLVRITLLARVIADRYDYGLVRSESGFKFDANIYRTIENDYLITSTAPTRAHELFAFVREAMFSDGRLVQNNFVTPISAENMMEVDDLTQIPELLDEWWFKDNDSQEWMGSNPGGLNENILDDDEINGFADSEFEEDDVDGLKPTENLMMSLMNNLQKHHLYHQLQHNQALASQTNDLRAFDEYFKDHYVMNADLLPTLGNTELQVEGDLGDRMDSSLTYITLDTNIWLKHCGRIFKCARSGVFRVLIPLIAFQELRSLRKSPEATIADAATRSVIIIRELYLSNEILPLRFDGTVASDINETTEFENNSNWMNNVDLTILNAVNEHDEMSKKLLKGLNASITRPRSITLDSKLAKGFRYCILITDDRNMRLRAKTSGLTSFQSKWLIGQLETLFPDKCID